MTEPKPETRVQVQPNGESDWKTAFLKAKQEAEVELQEIHRDAANRARELLRRAS